MRSTHHMLAGVALAGLAMASMCAISAEGDAAEGIGGGAGSGETDPGTEAQAVDQGEAPVEAEDVAEVPIAETADEDDGEEGESAAASDV